jgi:hypothetical protein
MKMRQFFFLELETTKMCYFKYFAIHYTGLRQRKRVGALFYFSLPEPHRNSLIPSTHSEFFVAKPTRVARGGGGGG